MQRLLTLAGLAVHHSLAVFPARFVRRTTCSICSPISNKLQFSTISPHSHHATPNALADKGAQGDKGSTHQLDPSIVDIALNLPPLPGQRKIRTRGVVINDLQATVEAQRENNRNPPIRKTISPYIEAVPQAQLNPRDTSSDHSSHYSTNEDKNTNTSGFEVRRIGARTPKIQGPSRHPVGTWSLRQLPMQIVEGEDVENNRRPYGRLLRVQYEADSLGRLDAEIKAFDAYMRLSPSEAVAVQECIDAVVDVASKVLGSTSMVMHGTRSTGLAHPLSDINFCIMVPEYQEKTERGPSPSRPEAKRAARLIFQSLGKAMKGSGRFENIRDVHGHVNLLKAIDKPTRLRIQFNANTPVVRERDFSTYCLEEYPQLRPLFMVIYQALQTRGLANVSDGGIGSYPLLILIYTALKHAEVPFRKRDLGLQLLHILEFWTHADTEDIGYAADPPRTFPKFGKFRRVAADSDEGGSTSEDIYDEGFKVLGKANYSLRKRHLKYQSNMLCLQDPANPTCDLGKKSRHIKLIQEVFRSISERIKLRCTEYNSLTPEERRDRREIFLIGPLVDARYNTFIKARARLTEDPVALT